MLERYTRNHARAIVGALAVLVVLLVSAITARAQIVALGASVVQGYGVSAGEAFPEQLQAMLRAKGKPYSVRNAGVFGDTTAAVLARFDSAVPEGTRIVILLIGGNDVRGGASVADAKAGIGNIVSRLQARKIRVIDATPYYNQARREGMVVLDGLHLNAAGQKYIASKLLPLIN